MYAPPNSKIAPLGASGPDAPRERATARWRQFPQRLPLVAIPYHQMRLKGNIIYNPARGLPEGLQGPLSHNCIADRRFCRGLRRPVIVHVAALRLFLRATIAKSNFMLILADLYDLE